MEGPRRGAAGPRAPIGPLYSPLSQVVSLQFDRSARAPVHLAHLIKCLIPARLAHRSSTISPSLLGTPNSGERESGVVEKRERERSKAAPFIFSLCSNSAFVFFSLGHVGRHASPHFGRICARHCGRHRVGRRCELARDRSVARAAPL